MTAVLLRRRSLGRAMTTALANAENNLVVGMRNDQEFPPNTDLVFRWGCTSNVPRGAQVVNDSEFIHRVNDKSGFRRLLSESAPHVVPETVFRRQDFPSDQTEWVVRPRTHAQGRHLWVVRGGVAQEVDAAVRAAGAGFYASRLINKVAEYRVLFFQGRVAWVANKTPGNPQEVAWNVARGGRFDNVRFGEWPIRVIQAAHQAFQLSGLDFGGVDVMVDGDGRPYILEINSAPSQTSPYRQDCTIKCLNYIVANGKDPIPIGGGGDGWRDYIHPAINVEARL